MTKALNLYPITCHVRLNCIQARSNFMRPRPFNPDVTYRAMRKLYFDTYFNAINDSNEVRSSFIAIQDVLEDTCMPILCINWLKCPIWPPVLGLLCCVSMLRCVVMWIDDVTISTHWNVRLPLIDYYYLTPFMSLFRISAGWAYGPTGIWSVTSKVLFYHIFMASV